MVALCSASWRKGPPLPTTCPTFGRLLEAVRIMDSTPIQLLLQMQEVGPRWRCRVCRLGHPHSPDSDDSYRPNVPTPEKRAEAVIRQATGPDYTLEGIRFVERPRRMDDDEDSEDNPQSA